MCLSRRFAPAASRLRLSHVRTREGFADPGTRSQPCARPHLRNGQCTYLPLMPGLCATPTELHRPGTSDELRREDNCASRRFQGTVSQCSHAHARMHTSGCCDCREAWKVLPLAPQTGTCSLCAVSCSQAFDWLRWHRSRPTSSAAQASAGCGVWYWGCRRG
jgi:hypothetical protein